MHVKAEKDELPHILVVDDDDRIRALVCQYLNENGFLAFTAERADQALELLEVSIFDAIVLDVMMPRMDGREMTEALRQKQNDIPILLLTALGETEDRIKGLSIGADDYLPKPFDPRELLARLQAILRRRVLARENTKLVQIGTKIFNPDMGVLEEDGTHIALTDVEVNLLRALSTRVGEVFSRDELARLCDLDAGERTIDVQVTRLRKKLERESKMPRYLQTVRGKGYILHAEEVLSDG